MLYFHDSHTLPEAKHKTWKLGVTMASLHGVIFISGSVHPAPRWVAYMNLCFCTSTLSACSFARLLFFLHRSHFQKLQKTGGEELSIHRILLAIALMKYGQPRIFRQTHLPQLPHSMAEVKVCWTSINLKTTYHGQRTPCVFNRWTQDP